MQALLDKAPTLYRWRWEALFVILVTVPVLLVLV